MNFYYLNDNDKAFHKMTCEVIEKWKILMAESCYEPSFHEYLEMAWLMYNGASSSEAIYQWCEDNAE